MQSVHGIRAIWCAALTALGLAAVVLAASASGQSTGGQFYDKVKDAEGQVKLAPVGDTRVGTFDAATGEFSGLVTVDDERENSKGIVIKTHKDAKIDVPAISVGLNFLVKNRQGEFIVTANGKSVKAEPTFNFVNINVGKATKVNWGVKSGNKNYADVLFINHTLYGAGAFKLSAVPVAILYAPPMDRQKKNIAIYKVSQSVGTTVRLGWSQDNSTTKPAEAREFISAVQFKSDAGTLAEVASKVPNAYVQAAAGVLTVIAAGMGSASASLETGKTTSSDNSLILNTGSSVGFNSTQQLGPGPGDGIIYLKNAKVVWLGSPDGVVKLSLIGYDAIAGVTVQTLNDDLAALRGGPNAPKVGPATKLPRDAIDGMLALDPFAVHGAGAELDPKRFIYKETFEVNLPTIPYSCSYEISEIDSWANTSYSVSTEDYHAGLLSFLGVGVTENKTLETRVTQSGSREMRGSKSAEAAVRFHSQGDELYVVHVYYDTVFGTFAFQKANAGSERIAGKAVDANGQPRASEAVTLMVGGKRFTTQTGPDGHFAFRSSEIPAGAGSLVIGGLKKEIRVEEGQNALNLELHPEM